MIEKKIRPTDVDLWLLNYLLRKTLLKSGYFQMGILPHQAECDSHAFARFTTLLAYDFNFKKMQVHTCLYEKFTIYLQLMEE